MFETIWSIYKITNLLNNKVYIGQSKNPGSRWSRHKSDARLGRKTSIYLHKSLIKYGFENFKFEIIIQTKNHLLIDDLEIFFIKQLKSSNRKFGYNLSKGGQANRLVSNETRKKLSIAFKGKPSPMLGKHHSELSKKLLSKINKGNKHRLGVKTTQKTKNKLSQINFGRKDSMETRIKKSLSMKGKNVGEKNGMFNKRSKLSKLTFLQAQDIRVEYSTGIISMINLSKKYHVSKRTIFNIIHNKIYRN